MNIEKRKKLEAAGWQVGDVRDFLQLTPEEDAIINLRVSLAKKLKRIRKASNLTQDKCAHRLKTTQPRLALMERGDKSVTIDSMLASLVMLGERPKLVFSRKHRAVSHS